ncbi:imidazole glycerol phosphate synthase subunit HisF [Aquimarina algicola]|uniref:imidazole glycerol-phosphate synthase n=1 Tax=Aquimarina algicola TaxID=2589995 RepID=A0A504JM94_9FLAO|nr:imidazole glycerol phosphate synthase cyclase subunit [Aquimarina algicola]TPN87879.1 imidazole glycerol phosphate synthase subunit HisF [Aquimarina algicola]
MNTVRCIARLDVKGPNLVKGIHLEGLRVLGRPEVFSEYYYKQGADELFYQDVVASLYERNGLHDLISKVAKFSFIPLTVGGGIRSIDDIKKMLKAGADKVAINTAAINNPSLISEAAEVFGSSTIVIAVEASKQSDGSYLAYTDNGREHTGVDAIKWAQQAAELGAGEIVVTSIDNEGTGVGFDTELINKISSTVSVPVIAHGGAGKPEHITDAIEAKANALAFASVLHYDYIANNDSSASEEEGNTEFLKKNMSFNKIKPFSIKDIKKYMHNNNIPCRTL